MQARIKNPASVLPGAMEGVQTLMASAFKSGVPAQVLHLVHLRTSQINGCSACVDGGIKHAKEAGVTDDRLHMVAAWREAPIFSDAERAALALAEEATRLDPRDPVPDLVWAAAAAHYDDRALAGLILWIALTNLFNRVNIATRQVAGAAW
jgi:AhpD family alkylhydroperoxidase